MTAEPTSTVAQPIVDGACSTLSAALLRTLLQKAVGTAALLLVPTMSANQVK